MYASARQRTLSALAALLTVAGGMLALVSGLAFAPGPNAPRDRLEAILPARDSPTAEPPEPTPSPEPTKAMESAPPGRPAPSAPRNRAAPIVAPTLPPLIVPPVPAARTAGTGSAASSGASDRDGAGQGAAGSGTGTGGGGSGGSGTGDGNGNVARLPRQVSGKLHYWEIPKELRRAQAGGVIRLRYRIGADGRVSGCTVLVSSGIPDFDRDTCARITERFRFRPALDPQGRPVPYVMTEIHGWDSAGDDEGP